MHPKEQTCVFWNGIMSELADSLTSLEVAGSVLVDALELLEEHNQDQLQDQLQFQFLKRLHRLKCEIKDLEEKCLEGFPDETWQIPQSPDDFIKN